MAYTVYEMAFFRPDQYSLTFDPGWIWPKIQSGQPQNIMPPAPSRVGGIKQNIFTIISQFCNCLWKLFKTYALGSTPLS